MEFIEAGNKPADYNQYMTNYMQQNPDYRSPYDPRGTTDDGTAVIADDLAPPPPGMNVPGGGGIDYGGGEGPPVVDRQVIVYGPDGTMYGSPGAARAAGVTDYTTTPPGSATITIPGGTPPRVPPKPPSIGGIGGGIPITPRPGGGGTYKEFPAPGGGTISVGVRDPIFGKPFVAEKALPKPIQKPILPVGGIGGLPKLPPKRRPQPPSFGGVGGGRGFSNRGPVKYR
jgi:hypothetical protein